MLTKLMLPEIRELIETRDGQTLSEALDMWQPADIAELFADLDDNDERAAFQLLHGPQRTLIFEYLDRPTQHKLLESLEPADAGALFSDWPLTTARHCWKNWTRPIVKNICKLCRRNNRSLRVLFWSMLKTVSVG